MHHPEVIGCDRDAQSGVLELMRSGSSNLHPVQGETSCSTLQSVSQACPLEFISLVVATNYETPRMRFKLMDHVDECSPG